MKRILTLLLITCFFASCEQKPTLQKYFVEKSESRDFIQLDLSPSILNVATDSLNPDQKAALESFEKINVLAFKLDEKNKGNFESERNKVAAILKDEKYQELMHFGKGKEGGSVSYVGTDESIEEFVIFANAKETGFAVVRVLGNDMQPDDVLNMVSVLQNSKLDMEQLKPLQDIIGGKK